MSDDDVFDNDNDSTRAPELAEVIRRHIRAEFADGLHVSIPCSVNRVAVDGSGNVTMVDCQPLIKDFHRDETGALVVTTVPIVTNIPIGIPGGGGVRLTLPIERDDLGYLTFVDRSMDRWLSSAGAVTDPALYQRFALTDAIFTPGLRPFGAPWKNWPSDHATLGTDGADDGSHVKIHFRSGTICVGDESGSDFLALAGEVRSALDTLQGVLNAIFATLVAGGTLINEPGNGAPSALQAALIAAFSAAGITDRIVHGDATWPPSVAATQAKGH